MSIIKISPMLEHTGNTGPSNGQFHKTSGDGLTYVEWHHENLTFEQYGYRQSGNHGADPTALEAELNKIYTSFRSKLTKGKEDVERLKFRLGENLKTLKDKKAEVKSRVNDITDKIQSVVDEIEDIRKNPTRFQSGKPNKISFFFGTLIAFLLTIYLWIFYSSASYSAFFRKFQADDINVANSIFDAQSVHKAWADGLPAFVLIASMPFVFLALGYLIHKFLLLTSKLKWISITLLVLVTFCFDFIIAYEIVKKIYDLKVANSLNEMPEYDIGMAWTNANFWLIIFAGFVTYLIWGFLFDKLIADHDKFDVVNYQIRIRETNIKELKKVADEEQKKGQPLDQEMVSLENQIRETEKTNNEPEVDPSIIRQFVTGWFGFITGPFFPPSQKAELIEKTNSVVKSFLVKNNIQSNLNPINNENS